MDLSSRPAATTKLIAGRLCLDFVNSVSGRNPDAVRVGGDPYAVVILHDKLNDYFDLLAWSHHAGLLTESDLKRLAGFAEKHEVEAGAIFQRAISLREAIYRVCRASIDGRSPDEEALAVVNSELALARQHERLRAVEASYEWVWDDRRSPDRMLWAVVRSAAELLTQGDSSRLHICEGVDCHWLFEDTSRNRSRQWCNMEDCGNLAKVRRFRARLRDSS